MHTLMEEEAREAPIRIAEQLHLNAARIGRLGRMITERRFHSVMMIGRGSSDHAGVFAKYLFEIEAGIPVFAAAPSVATVYHRSLQLTGVLAIVISQSGCSPDILVQADHAKRGGAYVVALVNDESSPLARMVDFVMPLHAGTERGVAATKSFLATLAALLHITSVWSTRSDLTMAVDSLPQALSAAMNTRPQLTAAALTEVDHLVVLARGPGFAIAKEMALKLKEVCSIHAEAFSSAEFLHGPVALANRALTVIDVMVQDESADLHRKQVADLQARGVRILSLRQAADEVHPRIEPLHDVHPRIAPLLVLQRFYIDVARMAVEMGLNPDQPAGLTKVTETL
jgi:glutamine---fructose-6-phosphate transaminase (isomerizing)